MKDLLFKQLLLAVLMMVAMGCGTGQETGAAVSPMPEAPTESTPVPAETDDASPVEEIAEIVAQRTPIPTGTPDPAERLVADVVTESGLQGQSLLGLTADHWLNLLVSILILLIGYVLFVRLLFRFLRALVQRTATDVDDRLLALLGRELRLFLLLLIARFAVLRLDFWDSEAIPFLLDVFFIPTLIVITVAGLRLLAFGADWYSNRHISDENLQHANSLTAIIKWLGYLFILVIAGIILLRHFGVSLTLLSAPFLFGAVIVGIIGVAGQSAIADTISGFLILADQPFRVGDYIYLRQVDTGGQVVKIGIRTTRIRTLKNEELIVPNSKIGENPIINYSYPDPTIGISTELRVAYGIDLDLMREVIEETVKGIEGVLPDKPVSITYQAFGDSARQVRVFWWIDSIWSKYGVLDRVNAALEVALAEAGIELPYPTYELYFKRGENRGSLNRFRERSSSDRA